MSISSQRYRSVYDESMSMPSVLCECCISNPYPFISWANNTNSSLLFMVSVLLAVSSTPVRIYYDGVLVARTATYRGV